MVEAGGGEVMTLTPQQVAEMLEREYVLSAICSPFSTSRRLGWVVWESLYGDGFDGVGCA